MWHIIHTPAKYICMVSTTGENAQQTRNNDKLLISNQLVNSIMKMPYRKR